MWVQTCNHSYRHITINTVPYSVYKMFSHFASLNTSNKTSLSALASWAEARDLQDNMHETIYTYCAHVRK